MGHRKTNTLTQKFASFLKDVVKAPPAPPPEPEPSPDEPELPPLTTDHDEWEETVETEETTRVQAEAPDVLDELNSATQRWKDTGDPGLHLEAPVPFSERAKQVWDKLAHDVSPKVASALKSKIEIVAATANAKLQQMHKQQPTHAQINELVNKTPPPAPRPENSMMKTPASPATLQPAPAAAQTAPEKPTEQQIDSAIIASWMDVLAKAEEKAPPNEREEIEKLYKQLSQ